MSTRRSRSRSRERDRPVEKPVVQSRPPAYTPHVDRTKSVPLMVRVFAQVGSHHTAEDFQDLYPTKDEFQIYTWKDATLKELTELIKGHKAAARARDARISFAFVYPETSGKNVVRQVGVTQSSRRTADERRTLQSLRFETGDYLDVAIYAS